MATPITDEEGNFLYYEDDPVSWNPADSFWNTPVANSSWDIMESSRELANINSTADADAALTNIETNYGKAIADTIKGLIFKPGTNELNLGGIAGAGIALYGMLGGNEEKTAGYNKAVPQSTLVREQIPYAADPNRRPGEAGRQYFTPSKFVAPADAAAAQAAAQTQAQGIAAAYTPRQPQVNPYAGTFKTPWENAPTTPATNTQTPASGVIDLMPVPTAESLNMAQGGIANLARGRYLSGSTDGMADKIPTSIDGKDPAALSHGEFVIPADVVSHLGNGNSEAGAEKLYAMMERVRKARTGNPKQGKRINPDKFMPGGLAYASGGEVKGFETGGTIPAPNPTVGTSTSSSLSPWAGPYVTNLLSRGEAVAQGPYQAYQGPLTAGASDLQQQAFSGIQSLAGAGYTPTTFTSGTFGSEQAQQYMNPYIQAALNPQLAEMKRQSDIARLDDTSRLAKAGAFGGSRQAIMESEGRRNLLDKQGAAIGAGYQTAYDKAMQQFNTEQDRQLGAEKETEASRRYSADYGLKSLGEMARLGDVQRSITAEGIAADKKAFEEERDYDASMVKFQRDLITGLPISTQATTSNTTGVGNISSSVSGAQGVIDALRRLGINI
jgi:hypothetical protein